MNRNYLLSLCLLPLLLAALCCVPALAAEGDPIYVSTVFNEQNGLPTGEANTVLQTSDGYLWIGSYGGLIRYDGSHFRNFSQEGALGSSSIRSLFQDSAGRLWIGTNDAGVFFYENDAFTAVPCTEEHSFLCIRDFAEGPDGTVYAASNSGIGAIRDGVMAPCGNIQIKGKTVYSLAVDPLGRLWGTMNSGLCVITKNGNAVFLIPSGVIFDSGDEAYCVASAPDGALYFGSSGSTVARVDFIGSALTRQNISVTTFETPHTSTLNQIRFTSGGDILISGQRGFAWRAADGTLREFSETEHAAALNCAAMDYDGNLWLASATDGLIRFSPGCYTSPNQAAGLDGLSINAITQAGGLYYAASDQGLLAFDADWTPVENSVTRLLEGIRVRHIFTDSQDRLWCATYSDCGEVRYTPSTDDIALFHGENGLPSTRVRTAYELADGTVAVGTQDGLALIRGDSVTAFYGAEQGLDTLAILCLAQSADGTLLAGSDGGGIYALRDGVLSNYGFDEGLGEGVVLRILPEEDGPGCFVSAGSSLYYWADGAFRKLDNFQKGAGSIFDLYEQNGQLWLMQNSGVYSVDKAQLLSGGQPHTSHYGANHGLTASLNANTWNYLAPDGSLYLSTRSGISVFGFHGVSVPLPKLVISRVQADGTVYEHPAQLTLDSRVQRLTVDFSALSFAGTADLCIAYALDGFDQEETLLDNTTSGTVSYTNLPGGSYTFRLRVFDPSDPGTEHTAQLSVVKEKSLTERPLFRALFVFLLILIAAGTVLLISHAKMVRLRQRQREYRGIVEQSLQTFANAIDAKDPYTNGHSLRVARYSREIARRMGLPKERQENIYYMALLHDIGKIGIPDHILNKAGGLTPEERAVIQTHPAVGGDILKDFTALEGISDGARYHHERYDGKGYCAGKAGTDIPLVARIIGVADSYDAMSSTRCYRKALSQEVILGELEKGRGTQFDPEIVNVMISMIRDGAAPIPPNESKS